MVERKVRLKMPGNIIYGVTNFGYIKACDMFKTLLENRHIEKKKENVIESMENLLYDGHEIVMAEYDMLTNEVVLYLGLKISD